MTISFLLELFDLNYFESDNSEEKNYKIESFAANQINLYKQLIKSFFSSIQLIEHGIYILTYALSKLL